MALTDEQRLRRCAAYVLLRDTVPGLITPQMIDDLLDAIDLEDTDHAG